MILTRVRQMRGVLRWRPFDQSTPEGRSQERMRKLALSAVTAMAAKVIGQLTMFISVPLALGYLGKERYGLWMAISSSIMMLGFTDLGIGLGLINAVSRSDGQQDRKAMRTYIASAMAMLCIVAVAVMGGYLLLTHFVSWANVFNVQEALARAETEPALTAYVGCFCLTMVIGIINRVQTGLQLTFLANLWQCVGGIAGLAGLILACYAKQPLWVLLAATLGGPILATLFSGWPLFRQEPDLLPRPRWVDFSAARQLLGQGSLFFILQITTALAYQSDNLVVTEILGVDKVPQYSVPFRLFFLAPAVVAMMSSPLWPAYSEALARGDIAWVKKTLRRSVILGFLITTPPTIILIFFGKWILHAWVGSSVQPTFRLLLGLGGWSILFGVFQPISMFLNGAHIVRLQVIAASLFAVANLVVSIVLTRMWHEVSGVIYGTFLTYIPTVVLPLIFYMPSILRKVSANAAASTPPPVAGLPVIVEDASDLSSAPSDSAATM